MQFDNHCLLYSQILCAVDTSKVDIACEEEWIMDGCKSECILTTFFQ